MARSTFPAASSFSGAAGSLGVWICTSSPARLKAPPALLGWRAGRLLALAAGGERHGDQQEQDERQAAGQRAGPSGRRRAQGTRRRSAMARAPKSKTAKAASRTTAAYA